MALKNLKSNKSKKNGKFNDYDEGFPKMKASPKGKEKVTKSKWKGYEPQEGEDEE
jgi:hypothetical protein